MAIEKSMKTRIVLTHDEYTALAGKTLKNGEVVLVKVGVTEAAGKVSAPIWMMKVGDGTSTVAQCPWLVAPAADVYEWAKKENLEASAIPTLPISKIDGFTEALAGKADSEHTHDASEITVGEDTGLDTEEIKTVEDAIAYLGEWIGTVEGVQLEQGDAIANKADKEEFDAHNHKASELTDFTADVQEVVNGMSLGDDIEGLDERVTALEADDTTKTYVDQELAKKVDKETYHVETNQGKQK